MRTAWQRIAAGLLIGASVSLVLAGDPPSPQPAGNPAAGAATAKRQFGHVRQWETLKARAKNHRSRGADDPVERESDDKNYTMFNLEFVDAQSCNRFQVSGTSVVARFDRFADVFVLTDDKVKAAVESSPGLLWYDIAQENIAPPPPRIEQAKELSRSIPDRIVHSGVNGLTGKGVIVAVVDCGVDFRHPDFITYDAAGQPTSRLLYFWDTLSEMPLDGKFGSAAPISWPDGSSIGVVYNRDELTAELRAPRGSMPRIPECDTYGHGTSCASIAAGNGNASKGKFAGVASEADIIAVRVGGHNPDDPNSDENSYLLNAVCDWLDKVAGAMPLVVTYSIEGQFAGHDGYLVEERELDARFPLDRTGRAICICAGNEGELPLHAEFRTGPAADSGKASWTADVSADNPGWMDLYVQTENPDDIQVLPDANANVGRRSVSQNNLTNQVVVTLPVGPGKGSLSVVSKTGQRVLVDAYLYPLRATKFTGPTTKAANQIASPGTAAHAITVGSYDWNDRFERLGQPWTVYDGNGDLIKIGKLSAYSNPGYRRLVPRGEEIVKPDLVSPGQWFSAAVPQNVVPFQWRDTTGQYHPFNGTSAATPYTAGVVALMMQRNPRLALGRIKDILHESASKNDVTGDCPNVRWGYGKLDYAAVERAIAKAGPVGNGPTP